LACQLCANVSSASVAAVGGGLASVGAVACSICQAGQYRASPSLPCMDCVPGTADFDSDPRTPCENCPPGTFAEDPRTTECIDCAVGQYDHDLDAITECQTCPQGRYTDQVRVSVACNACPQGRFQSMFGQISEDSCYACTPGKFADWASAACRDCQDGEFDEDLDPRTPCRKCNEIPGAYCAGEVVAPKPGWFMTLTESGNMWNATPGVCDNDPLSSSYGNGCCHPIGRHTEVRQTSAWCSNGEVTTGFNAITEAQCLEQGEYWTSMRQNCQKMGHIQSLEECQPPVACIGLRYGQDNCKDGYVGHRCSTCAKQFYRFQSECLACGDQPPLWPFAVAGALLFVYIAYQADKLLSGIKNVSELMAPFMILVTFFQTMALLLQISLAWPPELKELLKLMSFINFNIEIMRPDCNIEWNAEKKMQFYLCMPLVIMGMIFLYGSFK
jgi:hypothetical protein